jgi:hypothetical protein
VVPKRRFFTEAVAFVAVQVAVILWAVVLRRRTTQVRTGFGANFKCEKEKRRNALPRQARDNLQKKSSLLQSVKAKAHQARLVPRRAESMGCVQTFRDQRRTVTAQRDKCCPPTSVGQAALSGASRSHPFVPLRQGWPQQLHRPVFSKDRVQDLQAPATCSVEY